jgi:large conductance mechanosensitive channel
MKDFKQFLLRGNVVDLAVGVMMGAAFGAVVASLTKDLLTPLIAAIFGSPDFAQIQFTINGSKFLPGDFINAIISFVLIAFTVFFFVVKPVNYLIARSHREQPPDPSTMKCPQCLSEIPIGAKRCAFCTSELTASAAKS